MNPSTRGPQDNQPSSVKRFQELLKEATLTDNLNGVQSLMQQWQSDASLADPTAEDLKYILSNAANFNHPTIMNFLLDQGAEITPSLVTSMAKGGTSSTFQVLLDHGWDINSLLTTGAPMLRHILPQPPLVSWFLSHGADPNLPDSHGLLPLELAAHTAPLSTVQLLIQAGAHLPTTSPPITTSSTSITITTSPPNLSTSVTSPPTPPLTLALHAASSSPSPDRCQIITYLLDLGADMHSLAPELPRGSHARKPRMGNTALHCAAKAGNRAAAEVLLGRGAEREALNEEGYTPARWARRFGQEEMGGWLDGGEGEGVGKGGRGAVVA